MGMEAREELDAVGDSGDGDGEEFSADRLQLLADSLRMALQMEDSQQVRASIRWLEWRRQEMLLTSLRASRRAF